MVRKDNSSFVRTAAKNYRFRSLRVILAELTVYRSIAPFAATSETPRAAGVGTGLLATDPGRDLRTFRLDRSGARNVEMSKRSANFRATGVRTAATAATAN